MASAMTLVPFFADGAPADSKSEPVSPVRQPAGAAAASRWEMAGPGLGPPVKLLDGA